VSWLAVHRFIANLNFLNDGYLYRLPTEAEWEYAARGGTSSPYYADREEIAWYDLNSQGRTHPVGLKQPNSFGLYDMLGNVQEWCSDWDNSKYYSNSPPVDPPGASSGRFREHRGGTWYSIAERTRVSARWGNYHYWKDEITGFRVCREKR